ncbi:type IV pilus twitching motility protein PilT [Cellulosilyticum ruminicola]|uniref:type IV pilus twitching motility protein PilT n=1 Tax=Cellulosilyticum ruminicola TaxID=425254 RepID=UPI0006D113CB|nr:PilT/PilU family type 4a pilus ATPase [Cellulosilyticum ruminicola]
MYINYLLEEVISRKGSDLHLIVDNIPTMRLNGKLIKLGLSSITKEEMMQYVKMLLRDNQQLIQKLSEEGEVDFAYMLKTKARFRVNIFKQKGCYSIALRFIQYEIPSMKALGLPYETLETLLENTGLILVTGPTGSGKSTTLASMVDYINGAKEKHILTLEEPVEFLHTSKKSILNQREIGVDCLNFASGVRAALREDPDVILLGEIRDLETMRIALLAAQTGHLVLSTLHTIGAQQTVERVIGMFPPHEQKQICVQFASVLKGIISQQLLESSDTLGREVAVELMINNDAIKNLIREGKVYQIYSVLQTSLGQGMLTMEESLIRLCKSNKITLDTARNYSLKNDILNRQMNLI